MRKSIDLTHAQGASCFVCRRTNVFMYLSWPPEMQHLQKRASFWKEDRVLSESPSLRSWPKINTLSYSEQKPIFESKEVFIVGCQVLLLESSFVWEGGIRENSGRSSRFIDCGSRRWCGSFIPQIFVGCLLYSRHQTYLASHRNYLVNFLN